MLSEKLTLRLCKIVQDHHQARGFKMDYLEAWTAQRGHRVSRATISRVLNGKVRRLRPETAAQLAAFVEAETGGRLKAHDMLGEAAPDQPRKKRPVRHPISTVAGNGSFSYNGDSILAQKAHLFRPSDVCLDAAGVLYIADQLNHRIRAVDERGFINTVAGSGTARSTTFSGDGGLAGNALLYEPLGVAVDRNGDIYIADSGNHRVRKIDAETRMIATIAGTGEAGFSGDGGPAAEAALQNPCRVHVDRAGDIYISDRVNNRIRRIDRASGVISTVAGSGAAGPAGDGGLAVEAEFFCPVGLAFAPNGDFYITDGFNHRVRKVDAATGIVTTVAGTGVQGFSGDGGLATQAQFNLPHGVALDGAGNLFVAERYNHRVRRIDAEMGIVTTVVGTGVIGYNEDGIEAARAHLNDPQDLCFNEEGDLYIAELFSSRVRKVKGLGVPLPQQS